MKGWKKRVGKVGSKGVVVVRKFPQPTPWLAGGRGGMGLYPNGPAWDPPEKDRLRMDLPSMLLFCSGVSSIGCSFLFVFTAGWCGCALSLF